MAREGTERPTIQDVEGARLYRFWRDGGYFHTERDEHKKAVARSLCRPQCDRPASHGSRDGRLMQDVLIRFKRMQGYAAL